MTYFELDPAGEDTYYTNIAFVDNIRNLRLSGNPTQKGSIPLSIVTTLLPVIFNLIIIVISLRLVKLFGWPALRDASSLHQRLLADRHSI